MSKQQLKTVYGAGLSGAFRDFFADVEPVRVREPLAETLGAVQPGTVIEYSFIDTVKMAGHACPTVAGAYIVCLKALEALYPGETPVRGEIGITVYGEPDEGVYGVMGQVFSFLTGAAPLSGFRGLGPKFRRKDLLTFSMEKPDPQAMCFQFKRLDTGRTALVRFYPQLVPSSPETAGRMRPLMDAVVWEAAAEEEKAEFHELWLEKVRDMLVDRKDIDKWLTIEVKEGR